MRSNQIFYLLLILSLLVSCNEEPLLKEINVPENITSGDFYSQADKYTIGDNTYQAHSGAIIVPENRDKTDSRLIQIPFIQIHSTSDNKAEPIFFFTGGPGSPNIDTYNFVNNFIDKHDVVLVGFRGVDEGCTTILHLPEIDDFFANMTGDLTKQATLDNMSEAYANGA